MAYAKFFIQMARKNLKENTKRVKKKVYSSNTMSNELLLKLKLMYKEF